MKIPRCFSISAKDSHMRAFLKILSLIKLFSEINNSLIVTTRLWFFLLEKALCQVCSPAPNAFKVIYSLTSPMQNFGWR